MSDLRVAIIGAGRVGQSLARALRRSGVPVLLLGRGHSAEVLRGASLIVIAVPDDAIAQVAEQLEAAHAVSAEHVVLHTSGVHDAGVLQPLTRTGAAVGSWHPLQSFADRDSNGAPFMDAPIIITGDARARDAGAQLARAVGARTPRAIEQGDHAKYHAAAVFASNYVVVLAEIAARLAREGGLADASADLFAPLMRQTIANVTNHPQHALTGPVRRGDTGTVALHLRTLEGSDRELYLLMAREALVIARRDGLSAEAAAAMAALLATG